MSAATNKSSNWLLVGVAVVAMALGAWLGSRSQHPSEAELLSNVQATVLPQPRPLAGFHLTDHRGGDFDLKRFKDRWTFMFFGYTHCPDICPNTLNLMAQLYKALAPEVREQTQVVFVSVDPDRDTLQLIGDYVEYFHPDFIGATGSDEELTGITRQMSVVYAKAAGKTADDYLVDHSAAILLVDPLGRLNSIFRTEHGVKSMAADLDRLRERFAAGYCCAEATSNRL